MVTQGPLWNPPSLTLAQSFAALAAFCVAAPCHAADALDRRPVRLRGVSRYASPTSNSRNAAALDHRPVHCCERHVSSSSRFGALCGFGHIRAELAERRGVRECVEGLLAHVRDAVMEGASTSSSCEPIVSAEVAEALATPGRAVVALESTILCHGMPYPRNVQTAREVEAAVRRAGAVPATVAVLSGRPRVGLSDDELEMLGREGPSVRKVSLRDLAFVVATGAHGATTVSATMRLAHMAGVAVFVTGGIGGVHRGAEVSMDVSADLRELARTPVAVVCAGAKSILDIPKTLEYLETEGVPVATLGQDNFPAFFSPDSGCRAPLRMDSSEAAARLIHTQRAMALGGCLIAVPIPRQVQADGATVERATSRALREAARRGVAGNAVTPFILERVQQLTRGKSLEANVALIKHNAAVGADLAVRFEAMRASGGARARL